MVDLLNTLAALAAVFIPFAFAYACIPLNEKLKSRSKPRRSLRR